MRISILTALLIVCLPTTILFAKGGGSHGGGHSSSHSSGHSTSHRSGGTVHVRAYTRKDGTHVQAHTRRAPGTASASKPSFAYRTLARTEPRTTARTQAWHGTGSTYDDDIEGEDEPQIVAPILAPPKPQLKARYVVHLKSGRTREIANYTDEGTRYSVQYLSGGSLKYSKEEVDHIETIPLEMRIWTSTDGRTLEAQFISYANSTVVLRKRDGTVVNVPIERLIESDQVYARNYGRVAEKPLETSALP